MIGGEWKRAGGKRQSPLLVRFRAVAHENSIDVPGMCRSQIACATSFTDQVKLRDVQNRLGFLVALAEELAKSRETFRPALEPLQQVETKLERARLAREDTLCP